MLDALDDLDAVLCRHEAWRDFRRAANAWEQGADTLTDAVRSVRNRNRILGRRSPRRTVSRAVLVKGQEFDHCVVTSPQEMSCEEFYVAATRATLSLTVVAPEPIIEIRRASSSAAMA